MPSTCYSTSEPTDIRAVGVARTRNALDHALDLPGALEDILSVATPRTSMVQLRKRQSLDAGASQLSLKDLGGRLLFTNIPNIHVIVYRRLSSTLRSFKDDVRTHSDDSLSL